jgi:isoleucyl-tRNA synthetase
MPFKEYKKLDLPLISKEILDFWEKEKVFSASTKNRVGNKPFIFFEGPPSANGVPGIHHLMARTIKDIFCRFKTQKGFLVERKAGWDTHGLPVELGVEKDLGINKDAIGKTISIEDYNDACKKAVMRYTSLWNKLTEKMGYWVDMTDPYITFDPKYMESVWWLIKQISNKGLLYKGYSIQPYSPKAGTGLSSHELNQPGTYRDVTDTSVTAMFKTIKSSLPESLKEDEDLYILAWTTTPWTLPSNTALTIGSKIEYVVIKTFNQYTYLPITVLIARSLIAKQFGNTYISVDKSSTLSDYNKKDKKIPYFIQNNCLGKDLIDIKYEQLWSPSPAPLNNPENAFRVIQGDFVNTDEGTGIVHTAPTFGADDAKAAKEAVPEVPSLMVLDENKNPVPLVDLQGKFRKEVGSLAGKYVKNEYYSEDNIPEYSVDVEIAIQLKKENLAFKVERYKHSYPNCWRTDKPILYYPLDSWFIKVTEARDHMVSLNKTINWKPKSTGDGRFGNWLANANDWNLSRSRFWGIPIPIWCSEDKSVVKVIGSVEELIVEIDKSISFGYMKINPFKDFISGDMSKENYSKVDLHKNIVDSIILTSEDGGQSLRRESDLIDVWFDSGSMPYAQWHYPFENKDKIDKNYSFPADFIAEGVDQTRGWFYTLHTIGAIVFNKIAFKNVISNGLVLDKDGQKMSKRLGNTIDPFKTLDLFGPDATRWYMISNANPWDNLKFNLDGIIEVQRKFFGTLYNIYSFFSLYANIDGFVPNKKIISPKNRDELDNWILSELNSLIIEVERYYEEYEPTKVCRAISDFVQEKLSNWYVRLNRRRFWKGTLGEDKIIAYQTLYECLITITKLSAPIAPFYMDHLYRDLTKMLIDSNHKSVHLSDFPSYNKDHINENLQNRINKARIITSLALSLRKKEQIKVRQPLKKIMIPVDSDKQRQDILSIKNQLKSEINIKDVKIIDDSSGILVKQIKPNFKVLGPRFGKDLKLITALINEMNKNQVNELEQNGEIHIKVNEKNIKLVRSDVEISSKDIEGWLVAHGNGISVALDISLNDNLVDEGIAREFINRIQNYRKNLDLEVTDIIEISITNDPILNRAIDSFKKYIKDETLAKSINIVEQIQDGIKLEFDTINIDLFIKKIN